MRHSKMGRFTVPKHMLMLDEFRARKIFDGLVILQADYRLDLQATEYLALGDRFDEVPEGTMAPLYAITFDEQENVRFERQG